MKRLSLPALLGVLLALLVAGLVGPAPAHAQFPTPQYVAAHVDPCPGALVCGDFTKARFKSGGVISSQFQGLPNLTVARASFAYGENADGSLKPFQAGQARLTSKGLGVFEATTNALLWSQDFTNAVWTKSNVTITPNAAVAPDGALTAQLVTDTAANSNHSFFGSNATFTAATWMVLPYLKAGTLRYVSIRGESTAANTYSWITVDLQTCSVTDKNSAVGSTFATAGANGWCRVGFAWANANTNAGTANVVIAGSNVSTAPATSVVLGNIYTGGTGTFYVWGLDVRAGAYPVPYCPTAASTATCANDDVHFDVASGTIAPVNSYTAYVEGLWGPAVAGSRFFLEGGPGVLGATLGTDAAGVNPRALSRSGSARLDTNGNFNNSAVQGQLFRMAASSDGTTPIASDDGLTPLGGSAPAQSDWGTGLQLGARYGGLTGVCNCYLRGFAIYPRGSSQAAANSLTSGPDTSSLSLNFAAGLYKTTTPYLRTNLLLQSQTIGAAPWNKDSVATVTQNAATAPDGTLTASTLALATGSNSSVFQGFTGTATAYTGSVYVKGQAGQQVYLYLNAGSAADIPDQLVTFTGAWQRVWVIKTLTAASYFFYFDTRNRNASTSLPAVTFAAWGAQVEAQPTPSSYIATAAAPVSVATTQSTNPADVGALSYTGPAGYAPDCNGNLVSFAANNPRITGCGALIEEARTNSVLWSQQLDNAVWNKNAGGTGSAPVVTPDAALAPDGTMTADQVVFNAGAGTTGGDLSILAQNLTWSSGASYAGGFWIKGAAGQGLLFRHVGANTYTCITTTGSWQRVSSVETGLGTSGALGIGIRQGQGCGTLNPTATVFIWQVDVQAGAFITSPILTTSAAVTRPADAMSYGGLALSPTTLSLAAAGSSTAQAVIARIASLTDGTNNLDVDANGGATGYVTGNTLTGGGASVGPSVTAGLPVTVAASLNSGAVHGSGNGQAATTLAGTQTMGTITTLRVGDLYTSGRPLNGTVQQIRIYPYAANDNELAYRSAGNF